MRTKLALGSVVSLLLPSDALAAPTQITIWMVSNGPIDNIWKAATQSFDHSHPNIDAQIKFLSNDAYKQKIQIALLAHNPPTVFYGWGGGLMASYVKAGEVLNLTPMLKNSGSRYFPAVFDPIRLNGSYYGIPNQGSQPEVVFYNKAMFTKYHLSVPKTYPQFLEVASTLREHGVAPFAVGGRDQWPELEWFMYFVDRLGGPAVLQGIVDHKAEAWSNPAVLKAGQMIQQLVKAGDFIKGYAGVSADENQDVALVYAGKAAMLLQGSWVYPTFLSSDPSFTKQDLGEFTFPSIPGGKGNPNDLMGNPSTYFYIAASASKAQQQAAKTYLADVPFTKTMNKQLLSEGVVPPVKGIDSQVAGAPHAAYLSFIYHIASKAPVFQEGWDQALSPSVAQSLLSNLSEMFLLKMTPAQFAAAMNATLK